MQNASETAHAFEALMAHIQTSETARDEVLMAAGLPNKGGKRRITVPVVYKALATSLGPPSKNKREDPLTFVRRRCKQVECLNILSEAFGKGIYIALNGYSWGSE